MSYCAFIVVTNDKTLITRENTRIKRMDVLAGNFEKNRLEIPTLFCGCGLSISHPQHVTILKQHIISCQFSTQYPERNLESFRCGPTEAEHLKRNHFLTT